MEILRLLLVHFAIGLSIGLGLLLLAFVRKGGQILLERRRESQILDAARLIACLGALSNSRQWVITKGLATVQDAELGRELHSPRPV